MTINQFIENGFDKVTNFMSTRKHPVWGTISALDSLILAAGTVIAVLSNNPEATATIKAWAVVGYGGFSAVTAYAAYEHLQPDPAKIEYNH